MVNFNADGLLTAPHVHDALLYGLRADNRNELRLHIKLLDNSNVEIVFRHLKLLKVNNFREGNIIFSIYYKQFIKYSPEVQNTAWELRYGVNMMRHDGMDQTAILTVDTSYGCELVAIFEQIDAAELIETSPIDIR